MPVLTGSSRQLVHPSDSGMVEARDRMNTVERTSERPAEERASAQVGPGDWRTRKHSPRDAWPYWPCKKGGTAGHDAARPFRSLYASNARLGVFESRKGATMADSTVPFNLHESPEASGEIGRASWWDIGYM